jgi:hypothetical protein
VASSHAGRREACPVCQGELTIPIESDREERCPPAVGALPDILPHDPAPSGRQQIVGGAVLAGVLLAVIVGLAVLITLVFLDKDSGAVRAQAQLAGQAEGDAQTPAAALPDQLPQDETTRASRVAGLEVVAPETEEVVAIAGPPVRQPEPTATNPTGPPADPPGPAAAAKPQPPPPKKTLEEVVRERWASKRRSRVTDDELRLQLLLPPEVDLEAESGATKKVITQSGKVAGTGQDVVPLVTARRADLMGLPLRTGNLARMSQEEALNLKVLSQALRLQVQNSIPGLVENVVDPRPDADDLRKRLLGAGTGAAWFRPQAIATLRQLLMHEHRNIRLVLVDVLSKIEGRQASLALAERAVFDLNPDVRLAALVALKSRPVAEYEAALVAGLRYPWPAVADHAAESLVALDLRGTVPQLIPLLDARDLREPYPVDQGKTRRVVVPELVRMNHLRNCLLCHDYSSSPADPVRGLVPHAEHLVPLPASGARTTGKSWSGGNRSGGSVVASTFVRADITYLRQDFSVLQPVPNHGRLWPADQRYDYLIRLRPLTPEGLLVWQEKFRDFRAPEPQREALLFALRELTGEDPGASPEDWKRLYSPITGQRLPQPVEPADQVRHLRDCLVEGPPLQQAERLKAFRDKSGTAYDTALALAIPEMSAELQKLGRTVLADRFYCLPTKTLAEKLGDEDPEVRRAAVSVCRQRKLKALVPELIALLDDADQDVAKQAHQLLQQIAGRDLGPRPGADREERLQGMEAWRDWWERNQKQTAQRGPPS